NTSVTLNAPAGEIYYTLDGSDPREVGGAVSSRAIRYSSAIALNDHALLKARARSGGVWSALNEASFVIEREFSDLMITELMYHPPDLGAIDGEEFEFIELKNTGSQELQLGGIRFADGI